MKKQVFHNNRLLLLAIILLFSLTPCKVKASLFETFGATYEKTLNQSKVTISTCHSSCFIKTKKEHVNSVTVVNSSNFLWQNNFVILQQKTITQQVFDNVISLQFPPKYILYKRLKFDMA